MPTMTTSEWALAKAKNAKLWEEFSKWFNQQDSELKIREGYYGIVTLHDISRTSIFDIFVGDVWKKSFVGRVGQPEYESEVDFQIPVDWWLKYSERLYRLTSIYESSCPDGLKISISMSEW